MSNNYDNSISDSPVENTKEEFSISYDFSSADNSKTTNPYAQKVIGDIPVSPLAMGIGLAVIESECLYSHIGCICMSQYIHKLCENGKMDLDSLYYWLYVGEIYIKHQKELTDISFSEKDGIEKLLYLDEALKFNDKDEVFCKIKILTTADFTFFVKSTSKNFSSGSWIKSYVDRMSAIGLGKKRKKFNREAG